MATTNNQIAQKFTDETYSTKNSMRKLFGALIEPYWQMIAKYRDAYKHPINTRTIGNTPMYVILTDIIKTKVAAAEGKLEALAKKVSSLEDLIESSQAKRACLSVCLNDLNTVAKVNISELSFNALVNETYFENNVAHAPLVNYVDAIYYYSSVTPKAYGIDSLCEIFQKCSKTDIIDNIYRTKDWDNTAKNAKYQLNAVYPYCPADWIERCMEGFEVAVGDTSLSPLVKAVLVLFLVEHIKPFDSNNDAVAALSAKSVIAEATNNPFAFFLPFESLLNGSSQQISDVYAEVQKTGDLTYFLDYTVTNLSKAVASLEDKIANIRIDTYREESTRIPEIEKPVAPAPKPAPAPVVVEKIEEPREVVNGVEVIPHEEKKPVAPVETLTAEDIDATPIGRSPNLSDREVKEYIIYLMETEPDLNKKQASFYATHCTEGRYYTIQQFKQHAKCVYETARTSMDKLAAKGFYKKCALKNKFVYTPTKKRR